jgi:hypothetical protein
MKFRLYEFNDRRYGRGADAARVEVVQDDGDRDLLWMSKQDIKKNVMLFGPHLGLLDAARHYMMTPAQLVDSWRKGGDRRFLNAMEPVRDRDGYWRHPDWPAEECDAVMRAWLDLIDYEIKVFWLEGDEDAEDVQARWENGDPDILAWQPKPPAEGTGWFIVSIHDHEDGPVCIWARDKLAVAV